MCYPSPGPRCPSAALLSLDKAERKFETASSLLERDTAMTEIMEAKKQYDMTIQGQKQIEVLIEEAKVSKMQDAVTRLEDRLANARRARSEALEKIGVKDVNRDAGHKHVIPTSKEKPNERTSRLLDMVQIETRSLHTAEGWKGYLDTASNFTSMSFNNQLLVKAQNPTATNIQTYEDWRKAGRVVNKQNQATYLLAPTVTKQKEVNPQSKKMETVERITGFRSVGTFDQTETTGKDIPENKVNLKDFNKNLKSHLTKYGYKVAYITPKDKTKSSHLALDTKTLYLRKGITETEETKALASHLSHIGLGHDKAKPKNPQDLENRNVEAHALSYVIKRKAGIVENDDFTHIDKWSSTAEPSSYAQRVSKAAKYLFSKR